MRILRCLVLLFFSGLTFSQSETSVAPILTVKEIMNAIDKGVDVPLVQSGNTPLDYLRKGIIWGVIGIVLILGFTIEGDIEAAANLGSIPFAIGVGYLVYYKYATKEEKE